MNSRAGGEDLLERFLELLTESLDVSKTIEQLKISEEDAREMLKDLRSSVRPRKRSAGADVKAVGTATYTAYVDGASRGNPGQAGAGAVIVGPDGKPVKKLKRYLGVVTNNIAEYEALLMALKAARTLGIGRLHVRADSELMVKQLNGVYKVRSPELKPLYEKAVELASGFAEFRIAHVYREQNKAADKLANEAVDGGEK